MRGEQVSMGTVCDACRGQQDPVHDEVNTEVAEQSLDQIKAAQTADDDKRKQQKSKKKQKKPEKEEEVKLLDSSQVDLHKQPTQMAIYIHTHSALICTDNFTKNSRRIRTKNQQKQSRTAPTAKVFG